MTKDLQAFLDNLPPDWNPIKTQAIKYFDKNSKIRNDGTAQVYKRPWVAPENYGLLLFPPVEKRWLEIYKKQNSPPIPKIYTGILLLMNGCFLYDFSLFGLPKSLYTTGLLNRQTSEQYDLAVANTDWINEYNLDEKMFHIGGRAYSDSENIGYFINDKNHFLSVRTNGKVLNKWATFKDFITEEINESEKMMLSEKNK